GLVENMSYFQCPDCGSKHKIFGDSHIDEVASKYDIDTIAKVPINPEVASKIDAGLVEDVDLEELNPILEKIESL
ncbi:MAG: P-loop NTPase, partial [Finegoldia magna]|nr:P-loop NTPase [Finegoldia magna]